MENRTNQIIELDNGREYLILRQIVYNNDTYYVTCEVIEEGDDFKIEEGDDFKKELVILKESTENGETFVNIVNDEKIVNLIIKNIE